MLVLYHGTEETYVDLNGRYGRSTIDAQVLDLRIHSLGDACLFHLLALLLLVVLKCRDKFTYTDTEQIEPKFPHLLKK